jgi:lipopolysaccharide export system ATP-binding protein
MSGMSIDILQAIHVSKSYKGKTVVNDVSVEVHPGEIVGLLGPNGAGKTTTFRMIVGLVRPQSGEIRIGDQNVTRWPMYKRCQSGLGYLSQEPSIFRGMTVEDNVRAVLQVRGFRGRSTRDRATELLEQLGIEHLREQMAHSLSGGEKRRLEMARAMASDPMFILLDEPFAGVDPIAVEDIQTQVRKLRDTMGLGILVTDHTVRETLAVTDRAYIISGGKIGAAGKPDELINNDWVREIYLGESFYMNLPESKKNDSEETT